MFKAECQDCDWKLDCEIEGRVIGGPGEILYNHASTIRLGWHSDRGKLNRFVSGIHTHFDRFLHEGIEASYTHESLDCPQLFELPLETFKGLSHNAFVKVVKSYMLRLVRYAESLKYQLEMIDLLIQTEEDAQLVESLREQGETNIQIIQILHRMWNEKSRAQAQKEGQSHLEINETEIESKGKSVSIDEVLARIDEHLEGEQMEDQITRDTRGYIAETYSALDEKEIHNHRDLYQFLLDVNIPERIGDEFFKLIAEQIRTHNWSIKSINVFSKTDATDRQVIQYMCEHGGYFMLKSVLYKAGNVWK